MRTLVIFCAVLASVYTYSEACSCFPQHPQVQFCNADFVIKAKVLKRRETGPSQSDDVIYTVKIIQNYKRDRYYRGRRVQQIFTASNSALCGSFFETGREYIITGSIRENRWRTNLCSWNLPTTSLTQYQKNALNSGVYKNSCSCNVEVCFGGQCPEPSRDKCVVNQGADLSCFFRENSCERNRKSCAWRSPACF